MITLQRLKDKFTLDPDFLVRLDFQPEAVFREDEASRLLVLHDIFKEWRSFSRDDLLKLYKDLEWGFKHPPRLTYDKVVSQGFRLQVIPKQYLMRIELASVN